MREIKRILCPLDLSEVSRHAIDHAVVLARWYDAKITALHVCNPVIIPSGDFAVVQLPPNPDDIAEARARVTEYLASAGAWDRCYRQLMERIDGRIEQEIDRLGGDYAHVLGETIKPRHDDSTGEAWMYGRFDYELYRARRA